MFARADKALYKAKSNGRNNVENAEKPHFKEVDIKPVARPSRV